MGIINNLKMMVCILNIAFTVSSIVGILIGNGSVISFVAIILSIAYLSTFCKAESVHLMKLIMQKEN